MNRPKNLENGSEAGKQYLKGIDENGYRGWEIKLLLKKYRSKEEKKI